MYDYLDPRAMARPGAALSHTVIVKESTGSTNDDAAALAREGALHGTVAAAELQHGGRGRLGRKWISPAGRNLLFSVVLRDPAASAPPGLLTVAAGVAAASALARIAEVDPAIKWPNDVKIGGRKVCGILAEAGGSGRVDYVILGIGINVNLARGEMDPEIRGIATSLLIETGETRPREAVFVSVMEELEEALSLAAKDGAEELIERWKNRSEAVGKRVRVEAPGGGFEGVASGLRGDGALLVIEDGRSAATPVMAGDVIVIG